MMNLNQLQYFYEVAKHGGFSHASRALGIQQPAISRMVAQLEDKLDLALFEKVGNRVRLTRDGEALFSECQTIFERIEHLEKTVGQLKRVCEGPLTIGTSDLIASRILPGALNRLLTRHPKIQPTIITAPAGDTCERLLNGTIDLGLMYYVPTQYSSRLELTELREHRFSLFVKFNHRKNEETLKHFIGSREVDEISPRVLPALSALRSQVPHARIALSSNSLLAHRELVLEGLGVSILPDYLMESDLNEKRVARVSEKHRPSFALISLNRRGMRNSRKIEALLDSILEMEPSKTATKA